MCNRASKKMNAARKSWSKLITNRTLENLKVLEDMFKKAGASWKSFSEMEPSMPTDFPTRYFYGKKSDLELTKMLQTDFSPGGTYHNCIKAKATVA